MSTFRDQDPLNPEPAAPPATDLEPVKGAGFSPYVDGPQRTGALAPEGATSEPSYQESASSPDFSELASPPQDIPDSVPTQSPEAPLFQSWSQPEIPPPAPRIPHFGHLFILLLLALVGLLGTGLLTRAALYFHLFGIST